MIFLTNITTKQYSWTCGTYILYLFDQGSSPNLAEGWVLQHLAGQVVKLFMNPKEEKVRVLISGGKNKGFQP